MSLMYILGLPEYIEGVGNIYPIKLKDYDKFTEHSSVLQIGKDAFVEQLQSFPLLDLLVFGLKDENIVKNLEVVFSLSLRKEVKFFSTSTYYGFVFDDGKNAINSNNYELVRKAIMKHDLIFEPKIFKNKLVQEWANKVLKAKAKSSKITLEDMISVVHAYTGISYEEIAEYTIYQLHASFNRIAKIIAYETTVKFKAAGATDVVIEDYTERINLFKNPYDDLFVSKDKLGKVDQALK